MAQKPPHYFAYIVPGILVRRKMLRAGWQKVAPLFHYRGVAELFAGNPGDGNFVPQCGQFDQPRSTPRPQFGQVACSAVPQCGQKTNPDGTSRAQPGQGLGMGLRKIK
jgi:hypothetical protein